MNRSELIKKAQEIEAKYYKNVKFCKKYYGFDSERAKTAASEWGAVINAMCELLDLTLDDRYEIFF